LIASSLPVLAVYFQYCQFSVIFVPLVALNHYLNPRPIHCQFTLIIVSTFPALCSALSH